MSKFLFNNKDGLNIADQKRNMSFAGGITLGRVVNVHAMDYCVDVVFMNTGDYPSYSNFLGGEGNYNQRIPVMSDFAGSLPTKNWFSDDTNWGKTVSGELTGYGSSKLPKVGDYVIVAFLDQDFSAPVVLGSIHPFWRDMNITGESEKGLEDKMGPTNIGVTDEEDRYVSIYPSMFWHKVNKYGELEVSFPLGKGMSDKEGFFLKVGVDDIATEVNSILGDAVTALTDLKELDEALAIEDIPEIEEVIDAYKSGSIDLEEAARLVMQLPEARTILTGDKHVETPPDYGPVGCVCGSTGGSCGSASNCQSGGGCGSPTYAGEVENDPETGLDIENQGLIMVGRTCQGNYWYKIEGDNTTYLWKVSEQGPFPGA